MVVSAFMRSSRSKQISRTSDKVEAPQAELKDLNDVNLVPVGGRPGLGLE